MWMGLMYWKYCQSEASKNLKALLKTKDCLLSILVTLPFPIHSDMFDFFSRCTQVGEAQIHGKSSWSSHATCQV